MTQSGFLGWASFVATLASNYARAEELCRSAEAICSNFRLSLNGAYCKLTLCDALIGSREIRSARSIIRSLAAEPVAQDRYVRTSMSILNLKLAFAEGRGSSVSYPATCTLESIPRAMAGEIAALVAIAAAVRSDIKLARRKIEQARAITRTAEVKYLALYAEAILEFLDGGTEPPIRGIQNLVSNTSRAGVIDTFVTAYRAYPQLLGLVRGQEPARSLASATLLASGDRDLARAAGLENVEEVGPQSVVDTLTQRELEVLNLIAQGLSNSDIARQLVIAESTAKAHVHNLLKKLGVRNRLQAALLVRQLPTASEST